MPRHPRPRRSGRPTTVAATAAVTVAVTVAAAGIGTTSRAAASVGTDSAPAAHAPAERPATHTATMDHGAFDRLLRRHVAAGMVDYDAFATAPEFTQYLARLAATDPAPLPRAEQLAYWINAYNAYTIKLIVDKGERRSIRNVNKSLGFLKLKGPWSEPLVVAGGTRYTLDDVEHRVIRPRYGEPRIHFALVCAAIGCPPLRGEAYTGARLDAQLTAQAHTFLRESPEKNRVDVPNRTVYWSMIFNYYKGDFGGTDASVGRYIARWWPAGSAERQLLESGEFTAKETKYDWTLNSQENARRLAGRE